ncbi:bpX6 domain-containing protein [Lysobacter firmicutimachus]|uniref:BpX6 domain-containing protein n=1 Tax=Lysobacter firmicutimachus TaxID=1792846 RepID=A0AAU8MRU4_9GAMM
MTEPGTVANAPPRARHPVWRGRQRVDALWFDAAWLAPAQRERRILQAWTPGCRAWRFAEGDLLRFDPPRPLRCERAPGLPLCRIGAHALYSGPLSEAERAALPPADLHLSLGGALRSFELSQGETLDPSTAIELDDYVLYPTYDCSDAVAEGRRERLAVKPLRDVFGHRVPAPSVQREAFLERLARGREDGTGLWQRVAGPSERVAAWLLRRSAAAGRPATASGAGGVPARQIPPPPSAWRQWLERLAVTSRASSLLGARQGAYLRRLMQQFDRGDLLEALRHALPIDGHEPGVGRGFGLPGRRADLGLHGGTSYGVNIDIGDMARELLRKRYRAAFQRLDRDGRIDEAAFVLAELLNVRQEALDYLVRHQRSVQAAELALGWDMPADTVIRLLMLAGDRERAVLVARRDGAFASAVAMLESEHPEHALALRREWGQALVEQGRWLAAVDAVWPDPGSREQAARWLLAAENAGAELSAAALVQRAALLPDTLAHYAARIEALADPGAPAPPRAALGQALAAHKGHNRALALLATRVLPALAADRAVGANDLEARQLQRLLKLSRDPWLQADLPALQTPPLARQRLWERAEPVRLRLDPAAGLQRPLDVAALGGGRYLVALGEAGVAVVDRQGQSLRRYPVPASHLVIGDSGEVALAVIRRDAIARVSRLDLVRHRIDDLGAMRLQFFADRYDGIAWSVVADERIAVLDAARPGLDALWSVGDLGGPVAAAQYFARDEVYLVREREYASAWHYRAAPRRALVSRNPIAAPGEGESVYLHPQGAAWAVFADAQAEGGLLLAYESAGRRHSAVLAAPSGEAQPFWHTLRTLGAGLLAWLQDERRARAYALNLSGQTVAEIDWPEPGLGVAVREQAGHLLLFDAHGRVLDIDTETSIAHSFALR